MIPDDGGIKLLDGCFTSLEALWFTRVNRGEYSIRGVFDTMRLWWLGAKYLVSLDDIAWASGIESSKTLEVEGGKVVDLYQAGKLG